MRQEPPIPQELWDTIPPAAQAALLVVFARLEERIEQLEEQNRQLLQRVADLEARLRQNSQNSSKPPSSDPPALKRAPPKPPSGKSPGGQPGHERATRPLLEPTRVITCKPAACPGCSRRLHGDDPDPERFQVVELPALRPVVTEYQRHRLRCPHCRRQALGPLPAGVTGHDGPDLRALVVYLLAECRLSKRRVTRVLGDVFGVPCSPGQVCAIQAEVAEALEPVAAELGEHVRRAPVNVDETGWRQGKDKAWLWVAVSSYFCFFLIRPSRGAAVVAELLGPDHRQVVTSDRFSAYSFLPWPRRQWCWAHLRRDFQAMIDRANKGAKAGRRLLDASDELFHWWHRRRDGTCSERRYRREMAGVRERFSAALGAGLRCGCAKTAATCGELLEHEEMLWTFLGHDGVAPTNNAAERALRHAVCWRKTSYGTHSAAGSRFVATVLSVVMTCRQQGKNLWDYLRACCRAARDQITMPSLVPTPGDP